MAGRIPDTDIAAIRERVRIEDIVGEYVALRRAGADSMTGLCPFHDEKTPSFHVRPQHGLYYCFGCGEGGDAIDFIQKQEHVSFVEAVEQLADKVGYHINYTGGGPSVQRDRGQRARLVAANAAAQKFYAEALRSDEAKPARDYLQERNFDGHAALQFGCGYAPGGWDTLTKALLGQGFSVKELEAAGLSKQGTRGPIDRFHRRLTWPIRNLSGDVIGFGARKLFDDDTMGKYLNTPETMLYKKSQVLFGLDHAKKSIAKGHQVVIVEGYTDVMAMHLAGVTTAIASCGTAFGDAHLSLVRRLMLDDSYFRGEVIYTFDGDAAGRAAALKAFAGEQSIAAQTFVAIAPDGMDPCELRQEKGDEAVRGLVAGRVPMFQFAVKAIISQHDLDNAEGRVAALREAVPVVARIKDLALRDEYARRLAGWVGWPDESEVVRRVRSISQSAPAGGRRAGTRDARPGRDSTPAEAKPQVLLPHAQDPRLWPERDSLKSALQYPVVAGPVFDSLPEDTFTHPAYRAVAVAIAAAGGASGGLSGPTWLAAVSEHAGDYSGLVAQLFVESLPINSEDPSRFISGVLARLQEVWVGAQIADLKSRVKRMSPTADPEGYRAVFGDLVALESYRRTLLERAVGSTES